MDLEHAGALIRAGKLVAFPTETVYGLGANALDERAVEAIFRAKGRPATSPLIVHVCSLEMARGLARQWPEAAQQLAERFWPGPLTLVVLKETRIPPLVTAGLDTVGLRMPDHPLALELIRASGVPIAAPSANRFSELSPTTAGHVRQSLGDSVDLILDGGQTPMGLESAVLSLVGEPELLRPGMILREEIEAVIGPVRTGGQAREGAHRSPGMHRRHYSPATPLLLVNGGRLPASGRGAYVWLTTPAAAASSVPMPPDARNYARALYDTLHRLDRESFDWIAVEKPPETPEWAPVNDRLRRASQG
jgi:L-threonylcarbamoyladenylate synthase